MTCPMRSFPLFNLITFLVRGVAVLFPQLEQKIKEIQKRDKKLI
jgi:hypothetical protein